MKKIFLLLVLLCTFASFSYSQVSQGDFEALVALYNATDGDNWANNNNWNINGTAADVTSDWFGVTVEGGRVKELNLRDNNLLGAIPTEIGGLTSLEFLDINMNALTELPSEVGNLSSLKSLDVSVNELTALIDLSGLTQLDLLLTGHNYLDFGDLEDANLDWSNPSNDFYYTPQYDVLLERTDLVDQTTFTCNIGGTNNEYKWYKNGSEIIGETSNSITVSNNESAAYYCEITNADFPNLVLKTNTDGCNLVNGVVEGDYEALVAIYNATYGYNWQLNYSWLTDEKVGNWYGVTVVGGRVTNINLDYNNVQGELPVELGNLTALESLSIASNRITGLPNSISNLQKLENLVLYANRLTEIPNGIGGLSSLENLDLSYNQITALPSQIGNLSKIINLNFSNNEIRSIPIEIGQLTSLVNLNLRINQISTLPIEIGNLTSLENLNISQNQLNELPEEIGTLAQLANLYLSYNDLERIPELSGLSNLKNVQCDRNRLDFGDLEAINLDWSSLEGFTYNSQSSQPVESNYVNNTSILSLSDNGTNNQYTWYKDYVEIAGASSSSYVLPDGETGNYFCIITNPDFPDLELVTEIIQMPSGLAEDDYKALVRIYVTTGGENWTNSTNWLTDKPASEWYGVTVIDNKITEINLSNNNLQGWMPSDINNLSDVEILNLSNNKVTSISLTTNNLRKLREIYLQNNHLSSVAIRDDHNSLTHFYCQNNWLDFYSLEFAEINWSNITGVNYAPQAQIGVNVNQYENETHLTIMDNAANDSFQWYKDDEPIAGAVERTLIVTDKDVANYYCVITNPDYPDLTLTSKSVYLPAGIRKEDYDALVAIYNATGGDHWKNNTNWLNDTIPVKDWYGVDVSGAFVRYINLNDNNLVGNIPSEIKHLIGLNTLNLNNNYLTGLPTEINNLTQLNDLYIKNNKFSSLPDLSLLPNLVGLYIDNNELDFGDLENINILWNELYYSTYSPQRNVPIKFIEANGQVTISVSVEGANNFYKWYKDDEIIDGATDSSFVMQNTDTASYRCIIANPDFPRLTLATDDYYWPAVVPKIEYEALKALFNATDGDKWINKTNWLSDLPVKDWFGIVVEDNHVTEINLGGNNLVGYLPYEMKDLTSLIYLNINNNHVGGLSVSECKSLKTINASNNELEYIGYLSGLYQLAELTLDNNRLSFGSLENTRINFTEIGNCTYSPQTSLTLDVYYNDYKKKPEIFVRDYAANSRYVWYKDSVEIPGQNLSNLLIQDGDMAYYHCVVTNPDFPDLTLTSERIYVPAGISKEEYEALVALYESTDGENWTNNTGWLSDRPVDDWYGITVENGKVTKIKLAENNLVGIIPPELGDLSSLTELDLDNNSIESIPQEIGNLFALKSIYLNFNKLINIPAELGKVSSLQRLGLTNNNIIKFPSELGELGSLQELRISNNQLSSIPSEIKGLKSLQDLDLSTNKISEVPSEIGELESLRYLILSKNEISEFPVALINLDSLETLSLDENKVEHLPEGIGDLSTLTGLNIYGNQIKEIPQSIGQLTNLGFLNIGDNKLTSLPKEIGDLRSLRSLYADKNQLKDLPDEMSKLTGLNYLRLSGNEIEIIPPEIWDIKSISILELGDNKITKVPDEISTMTNLFILTIDDNLLDSVPDLSSLPLRFIVLSGNKLNFGALESMNVDLRLLPLKGYAPQSNIPLNVQFEEGQISAFVLDNGSNNQYHWYKNDALIEGANSDTLIIEDLNQALYKCNITNPDFPDLTLSSDSLYLPAMLSKNEYDALVEFYNATGGDSWVNNENWLSDRPVKEWYGIEVDGFSVSSIALEGNNLTGSVPASVNELTNLTNLDLSNNEIVGIPDELNNMASLKNLLLDQNQLDDLPNFTSLEKLTVANNKLTFEDIESNIGVASVEFSYSPQSFVGEKEYHDVDLSLNDTLIVKVEGENNVYQWYHNGEPMADIDNDTLIIADAVATYSGEYYCEITNTVAADLTLKSDTFYVTVYGSLIFRVSDKNGLIENATVILGDYGNQLTNASGEAFFEEIICGEELTYTISAPNHSDYTSAITINSADDTQIDVNLLITGFKQKNSPQTKIYPNPSTGNFVIQLDKQPTANCHVDIIDLAGRKVYSRQLNDSHNELSMDSNLRGAYILRIVEDSRVVDIQKVVFVE